MMVAALAFVGCKDDEFSVDTGTSTPSQQQHVRQLMSDLETFTVPNSSVSFDMVLVKAGTFVMGGVDEEGPAHEVTLTHNYYIGSTEVTQALYYAVMKENPSVFSYGENYPVDNVSHKDAVTFCQKLTQLTD